MVPNYFDISYFIEVAESGNISRAAERLGITQPSLSSSIKRLESLLGVDLLIRSRTGVQLTKPGREFLTQGRKLLQQWEQIKLEVTKREDTISGQYVLGCHPSVSLYTLSQFLPSLIQRHPELEVKIVHDLSRKITEGVISFEIDFGIVVNPVKHPDLVIRELCRDEVHFWRSENPSSTQQPQTKDAVLICDPNLTQVQKMLIDLSKKGVFFPRTVTSSNLEVITDLVSSGTGIGVLPQRVAKNSSRPLQIVDRNWPSFQDRICLVYRSDFQKTKGSQKILKCIREVNY